MRALVAAYGQEVNSDVWGPVLIRDGLEVRIRGTPGLAHEDVQARGIDPWHAIALCLRGLSCCF